MLYLKKEFEKEFFETAVSREFSKYDPERRMHKSRDYGNAHSRIYNCEVHKIRESLELAYMLLNRDAEGDREVAHDILYRVLPLQDINPARKTYGIWSYYLEEDVELMNPPDMNWADFNGRTLLYILNEHSDKLTDDLKMRVKDAIIHACRSIIRRNVGPSYTNISIMGTYVTVFAGELLENSEIFEYGKKRLAVLHEYNISKGNFTEFNSPAYTFVCIDDLSRILQDVKDKECLRLASELNDLAWKTIALHYHPTTGQLAGPHYRAYSSLIGEGTRYTIERALNYKINIANLDNLRKNPPNANNFSRNINCPEKFVPYFMNIEDERLFDDTFASGLRAYTYMKASYTLGSLRAQEAWNQHRNVLGYFGSVNRPVSVTIRSQLNFWDYRASYMSTVQDKGRALTATTFTFNGSDTHLGIQRINDGTVKAKDMRVRYVFEGAVADLDVVQDGNTFIITHKESGVKVKIAYPHAKFGKYDVKFELVKTDRLISADAVLYSGEETDIKLGELLKAGVVSSIEMTDGELSGIEPFTKIEDDKMVSTFGNLLVSITENVGLRGKQFDTLYLERDGVEYKPEF